MADDRFYVKSLTLENFRCFEKAELGPFDPHFNLLIGENGSGKSSVLLALASLFRPLSWVVGEKPDERWLGEADVRIAGARRSFGMVQAEDAKPAAWKLSATAQYEQEYRIFTESSDYVARALTPQPIAFPFVEDADGKNRGGWAGSPKGSPHLIAFYGVSRKFREKAIGAQIAVSNKDERDWRTAGTDVGPLKEWFRDQTLLALQGEQRKRPVTGESPATQLSLVKWAVAAAYSQTIGAEYDGELMDIVVRLDDTRILSFREMSDGQRALAGLVADIARRAFVLNGSRFGAETLQRTTGLVLIDEIDLHLHPKWQRQIVGALKRIFPKIQFFATTHSPQIIGEAKPHEIVLLTAEGQKRPPQSFGMDSNWILECVMGAEGRDPVIAAKIKSVFDSLDDGRFEEARRLLEEVRDVIGEAPDVVAADAYLWNIGVEGEEAAE